MCLVTKIVPVEAEPGTPLHPSPRPLGHGSRPVACFADTGMDVSGAWRTWRFLRPVSVPDTFAKVLWRVVAVEWGAGELFAHKLHLYHLQCLSTDCSMSTWCLQAATLLWRWGGRSTRRKRCMLTSWALSQSGCVRATASVRSTSQKVTGGHWGWRLRLCSQLFRGKYKVYHLDRVEEGAIFSKIQVCFCE